MNADRLKYLGVLLGAILGGFLGYYIGCTQLSHYEIACIDPKILYRAYIIHPMTGVMIGIMLSAIAIECIWGDGFKS